MSWHLLDSFAVAVIWHEIYPKIDQKVIQRIKFFEVFTFAHSYPEGHLQCLVRTRERQNLCAVLLPSETAYRTFLSEDVLKCALTEVSVDERKLVEYSKFSIKHRCNCIGNNRRKVFGCVDPAWLSETIVKRLKPAVDEKRLLRDPILRETLKCGHLFKSTVPPTAREVICTWEFIYL